jgi:hypothetical protein
MHYTASATKQRRDILIYEQDTFVLDQTPFDPFEEKLKELKNTTGWASNCWRGYQAEWTVIDSVLYLSNVYYCNSRDNSLNRIAEKAMGKKFENGLIKADWVSGEFWAERGYVMSGYFYESIWEHSVNISIKEGKVGSAASFHPVYRHETEGDKIYLHCFKGFSKMRLEKLKQYSIYERVILYLDNEGNTVGFELLDADEMRYSKRVLLERMAFKIPCYTVYNYHGAPIKRIEVRINITKHTVNYYLENK